MNDLIVKQQEQIELLHQAVLKHIETQRRLALCLLRLHRASEAACGPRGVSSVELAEAHSEASALLNSEHNLGLK